MLGVQLFVRSPRHNMTSRRLSNALSDLRVSMMR